MAKTGAKKIVALNGSEVISSEVGLYLYKSTIDHAIIVLPCLGWWSLLLFLYVRETTETGMKDCWSYIFYF